MRKDPTLWQLKNQFDAILATWGKIQDYPHSFYFDHQHAETEHLDSDFEKALLNQMNASSKYFNVTRHDFAS